MFGSAAACRRHGLRRLAVAGDGRLSRATWILAAAQIRPAEAGLHTVDRFVAWVWPIVVIDDAAVSLHDFLAADHERLDARNGLLLNATLDALFDKGLITFEDSGEMRFSKRFDKQQISNLLPAGSQK